MKKIILCFFIFLSSCRVGFYDPYYYDIQLYERNGTYIGSNGKSMPTTIRLVIFRDGTGTIESTGFYTMPRENIIIGNPSSEEDSFLFSTSRGYFIINFTSLNRAFLKTPSNGFDSETFILIK